MTGSASKTTARSSLLPARVGVLAALVPIVCGVLVIAVSGIRLVEGERKLAATKALLASTWLADRLSSLDERGREVLVERAGRRLDARVGLFDERGSPVAPTSLAGVPAEEVTRWLAGEIRETLVEGRWAAVAAATLRPPLGRINVAVVVPGASPALAGPLGRLAVLVVVLALAVSIFGVAFGRDLSVAVSLIERRLDSMATLGRPEPEGPSALSGLDEIDELTRAAADLQERFRRDMALWSDALDEVDALDRQKTAFLATLSADLREPLAQIARRAERLMAGEEGELTAAQAEDVRIVHQATRRLLDLLAEIEDLSSLTGGRVEFDAEPVDLVAVSREVVEAARGQIGRRSLDVGLVVEGEPAPVVGSRRRLWQVITNLVSNALKFTDKGAVTVRVSSEGGDTLVRVSDTGEGIPPEDQDLIFEAFRQSGSTAKRRRGSGLGLAICRKLVELHGGEITVESRPGQGATFTIRLRRAP